MDVASDGENYSGHSLSSRAPPTSSPADCATAQRHGKHSLYRTCCTSPEKMILKKLKELSLRNKEFLCQDPNDSDTNAFCKHCGTGIASGGQ